MRKQKRRSILAGAGAIAAGAALALSGAVAAHADDELNVPAPDSSTVFITKCAQPADLGDVPDGTEIADFDCDRIAHVTFSYYLVPGTGAGGAYDMRTNEGQTWASTQTVASAKAVAGFPATATGSFDETSARGETSKVLPSGLYVIEETGVPAGVTASVPFLLAVPLTDPAGLNQWLETIFVYPKNAKIEPTKTVDNATDYVVGDSVTWTVETTIPRVPNPDYKEGADPATPQFIPTSAFLITDELDSRLATTADPVVLTAPAGLTQGSGTFADDATADYFVTLVPDVVAGTTTVKVQFTENGRAKLAAAVNDDPSATVTVTIETQVLESGEIPNTAQVYPNADAIDEDNPVSTNTALVKYGKFNVQKLSTLESIESVDLDGAVFRVYSDLALAQAKGDGYLQPWYDDDGTLTQGSGEWTTANGGWLTIDGLRYSDFANNAMQTQGADDSKYVTYYLVEVKALEGHQLLADPIAITVNQETGQVCGEDDVECEIGDLIADQQVTNVPNTGGFQLPLTGGTGTVLLTIGGIVLLAAVLLAARRRRALEAGR